MSTKLYKTLIEIGTYIKYDAKNISYKAILYGNCVRNLLYKKSCSKSRINNNKQ